LHLLQPLRNKGFTGIAGKKHSLFSFCKISISNFTRGYVLSYLAAAKIELIKNETVLNPVNFLYPVNRDPVY